MICVAFFIFRPHILQIGEKNHDMCCVFIFRPHILQIEEENRDLLISDPYFTNRGGKS